METPPQVELVVARCGENVNWARNLERLAPGLRVTIYDKSPDGAREAGALPLPNLGREAHTHLHHMVTRFHSLAAVTVFAQGHPFDHVPDLKRKVRRLAEGTYRVADFEWLGFIIDTDDARGRRLHVPWTKNPEGRELPLEGFHQRLLGEPSPAEFVFRPGGQFIVTRDKIRRRPLEFYQRALELASEPGLEPACCFERVWDRVFGVEGPERAMLAGAKTLYLRRTKRGDHPLAGDAIRVAPIRY
ncbi:MAG: DUF3431 domain-containing protein [Verrucomicrobiota bacterium]